MNQDYKDSLEEAFVLRFFDMGDDLDTLQKNLSTAQSLKAKAEKECEKLASALETNQAFDKSQAILYVQMLVFASAYEEQFERELQAMNENTSCAVGV